jgi:hypothetical protein
MREVYGVAQFTHPTTLPPQRPRGDALSQNLSGRSPRGNNPVREEELPVVADEEDEEHTPGGRDYGIDYPHEHDVSDVFITLSEQLHE